MAEPDLNLLRVFDTLFDLRSVTRTAARLNLTQSAVSHALGRLRREIGDPLFVRGPQGFQPTARAIEIAPGLHDGLARLRHALAPSAFEPTDARRAFSISASAYFSTLLIPALLASVRAQAPGVSLRIRPPVADLAAEMDGGRVDLALGVFGALPGWLADEPLFVERLVWIAARGHPLAGRGIDVATVSAHPRLTIVTGRPFDVALLPDGEEQELRPPVATAYESSSATAIVGATDLVALVPRSFALRNADQDGVAILDVETEGGSVTLAMVRHRKGDGDPGLAWLRALVLRVARETFEDMPAPSA